MKRICTALAALALAATTLSATPGQPAHATGTAKSIAAADDDKPQGEVVPVQVTGNPEDRWNLVVLGDGFTAEERDEFLERVDEHLNVMWSLEPYRSYRNYINVYAVTIPSPESGVSCDPSLDAPVKNTPLKMKFWSGCRADGIQRLLVMDQGAAKQYAGLAPKADQVLALANSSTYGGAGGSYATASAGNPLSALISPHELGHSFGKLQDEYDYYARGQDSGSYTGSEPTSVHHSLMTQDEMRDQQAKWWRWLGERSESGGTIGRFEGGLYKTSGIWRPSQHSMMKSLGFYMDQVSREHMTAGLSGAINLIQRSTPNDEPVGRKSQIWIDPAHPVFHELDISWQVNGRERSRFDGDRSLDLRRAGVREGDEVTATVVDNTEFVRDPKLRSSDRMTEQRTWTVGPAATEPAPPVEPGIVLATPNEQAVGSDNVLWVDANHPRDYEFTTTWRLDGRRILGRGPSVDLGSIRLPDGNHTVSATITDPKHRRAPAAEQSWVIDNTDGTVTATVADPIEVDEDRDGNTHYTVRESFTLDLANSDDQPGHVVSEFRVNGDGWYHYFGSPEDASAPFPFTTRGTNVDDLIYGNLGTGGISLSPFAKRTPGYGTHTIEYRTIDAAGNIADAQELTVTVLPETDPEPGAVPITAEAVTGCPEDETVVEVTAVNDSDARAKITVETDYGRRTFAKVRPGRTVTAEFETDQPTTENGTAKITATSSDDEATYDVPFNRYACS